MAAVRVRWRCSNCQSSSSCNLEALDNAIADLATADDLRGYLDQPELQAWLARLRRTRPEQAAEADTIISAAWARVRAAQDAEAAALPEWAIVGSDGRATEFRDGEAWLVAWRARVDAIEAAPRSIAGRRAALERFLALNGSVLHRMQQHGSVAAALDATALAAQADGRLVAQEQDDGDAVPLAAE